MNIRTEDRVDKTIVELKMKPGECRQIIESMQKQLDANQDLIRIRIGRPKKPAIDPDDLEKEYPMRDTLQKIYKKYILSSDPSDHVFVDATKILGPYMNLYHNNTSKFVEEIRTMEDLLVRKHRSIRRVSHQIIAPPRLGGECIVYFIFERK